MMVATSSTRDLVRRAARGMIPVIMAVATFAGMGSGTALAEGSSPWPTGTFQEVDATPECIPGFTCTQFQIDSCPDVTFDGQGILAQAYPSGGQAPTGLVVFFSGGTGQTWWSDGNGIDNTSQSALRNEDRIVTVQVKWIDSWLQSQDGTAAGSAHLACRPATVVKWVYDNLYLPLGIDAAPGTCGFCITGNSGGSSQSAYALSHYGLDTILDGVFLSGGPPHAAQEKGCQPGYDGYRYEQPVAVGNIDSSFGYLDNSVNPGPCDLQDPSWIARWQTESVDTGGSDYSHPNTRIEFVIGDQDFTTGVPHGRDYYDKLLQDPANDVTWTVVPGMGHTLMQYQVGLDAISAAILGESMTPPADTIPPTATITSSPSTPTGSTSATIAFEADEAATFACSLDGAAAKACDAGTVTYTGLLVGSHSVGVTPTDTAGNVGETATVAWSVVKTGATVSVSDTAYTKKQVLVAQGKAVMWNFVGTKDQTVTDSSGMGLFDSGSTAPGGTYTFVFTGAGYYGYTSTATPSMTGAVKVPVTASASSGKVTDTFTITWASAVAPAGFDYDIQVQRPGSTVWKNWKINQTGTNGTFVPDAGTGTYLFRGRMQNTATGKASLYSPSKSIVIS